MSTMPSNVTHLRQTRSFVRRQGRMTDAQRRAIEKLWARYVINMEQVPELLAADSRQWILEIGFGMGESLSQMAAAEAQCHFLGIEVHRPGIGALLAAMESRDIDNIHIVCGDALDVLQSYVPDSQFSRIQVFFPDPWPKKKHHKRRLINPENAQLLFDKLISGGELHIATDWPNYAEHIEQSVISIKGFSLMADKSRPSHRPFTKFEQRGERLGHPIVDLRFIKD